MWCFRIGVDGGLAIGRKRWGTDMGLQAFGKGRREICMSVEDINKALGRGIPIADVIDRIFRDAQVLRVLADKHRRTMDWNLNDYYRQYY